MTDDLSTRLLSALDDRERIAAAAVPGSGGSVGDLQRHVGVNDPAAVLRLCQAHREIVDMYQQAEDQRGHGTIRDLDHASAMGRLTTLGLVLQALSRAYRIQEET